MARTPANGLADVPRTGGELRAWRTRAGRSQRAVAEMLGVSPRTIMRAEKRANAPLSDRLLAAIRGDKNQRRRAER